MSNVIISVTGLGYVGLPVAVAFSHKFKTIGFDVNQKRINELKNGIDLTNEVETDDLKKANIDFTFEKEDLSAANFHIIAVPTPIDQSRQPDFTPLIKSSESIGSILKKGDTVVYESTVYPGATEEVCVPVLEKFSGLKNGEDFKVGYSPERINPGDKTHTFTKITKVVSGQDEESLKLISKTYASVVEAGVFKAASIKVAEAAKVIENTQRDLNIALMNELSVIFDKLDINTTDVIAAAGTKWNFLKFYPGLVGGHCIGVDPYYLTHKAEMIGYHPQVILSGRKINDGMGKFIAEKTVKQLIHNGKNVKDSCVTILGLTFKEDCPDLRNTKVTDVINELQSYGIKVQVHDPMVDPEEAMAHYGIEIIPFEKLKKADAIIGAVKHKTFLQMSTEKYREIMNEDCLGVDVKSYLPREIFNSYWAL